MALFTPSASPAITVKEIDLTGVVPNVQTSTGAFVGDFSWGPAEETTLISNEARLAEVFGTPDSDNTIDFHSAAYFLRYGNSLQVVREVTSAAKNSFFDAGDNDSDAGSSFYYKAPVIKNETDFDNQVSTLGATNSTPLATQDSAGGNISWAARFPGELGNSLKVSVLGAPATKASSITIGDAFDAWTYADQFDAAPGTSTFASDFGASNDEIHVVVVDEDGLIGGTKGAVLEAFPFLSKAKNALNADGSTNYVKNVINNASNYIYLAGEGYDVEGEDSASFNVFNALNFGADAVADRDFGQIVNATTNHDSDDVWAIDFSLTAGVNSAALTTTEYATGFDLFEDVDNIEIDMMIAPGMNSATDQRTVVNDMVAIAQSTRKDCVVVASPPRSAIINNNSPVTDTVSFVSGGLTRSSYLFVDNNYLKVYDKYNDQFIQIPASSSTAGLFANTDRVAAPFFSPAGPRRGQYLGITNISYSPTKSERDTLYKSGVNPIANLPGQGILLFGDKTMLARPSAFDRINVRRLFLAIERAIALAARNVMFEFNDEFTRAEFVNVVEPFLREIQGRRGITDFRVVCDETNNTAAVIDRNEFVCNIFIKPARSINYVTLNFVAVRTGVDFEEVVGLNF